MSCYRLKASHASVRQTIFAVLCRSRSITAQVPSTTTVRINPYNVSRAHSQYNPDFISYLVAMLTWTQLRASRRVYLASAGVVGTVVAETSNSGDQSSPADVGLDVPAQSATSEANVVPIVAEPEPHKTVFADLPEKVPFVDPIFFLADSNFLSGSSRYTRALHQHWSFSTRLRRSSYVLDKLDGKCMGTTRVHGHRCRA